MRVPADLKKSNYLRMKLWIFLSFLILPHISFSQKDSSPFYVAGIEVGYFSYGSIDELFTPFAYAGYSVGYGIFTKQYKPKSRQELRFNFVGMTRTPTNISVPQFYYVVGYDSPHTYKIESEKVYRELQSFFFILKYSYYRKLNFHLLEKDNFFLGFENQNSFIYRNHINDHELVSLNFSPGIIYEIDIKRGFKGSFESNISLFALNLRKPYAVATAQVSNNYNSFLSYFKNNATIDFLSYLNVSTRLKVEKYLLNRINVYLFYDFAYLRMQNPRKLTSVINSSGIGCFYKFGNYGKK